MANWWQVFPASEAAQYSNSASPPPGTELYSTTPGSADDNALHAGGTVTIGGKPYSRYIGPYGTKAAAQSATANTSTIAGITAGVGAGLGASGLGGLSNPLQGLAAIGDFFSRLAEGSTWIRVAECILGVVLIAIGMAHMTDALPVATRIASAVK